MRLTPAQLGVHLICGADWMPQAARMPLDQRLREGREMLRKISGQDFGYDLGAWHSHLKASGQGGYTWRRRDIELPRIMKAALASAEWRGAVSDLQGSS